MKSIKAKSLLVVLVLFIISGSLSAQDLTVSPQLFWRHFGLGTLTPDSHVDGFGFAVNVSKSLGGARFNNADLAWMAAVGLSFGTDQQSVNFYRLGISLLPSRFKRSGVYGSAGFEAMGQDQKYAVGVFTCVNFLLYQGVTLSVEPTAAIRGKDLVMLIKFGMGYTFNF
ncbi:MAG: hypothetical protein WC456_00005 [Patescibacteria group bacterium]